MSSRSGGGGLAALKAYLRSVAGLPHDLASMYPPTAAVRNSLETLGVRFRRSDDYTRSPAERAVEAIGIDNPHVASIAFESSTDAIRGLMIAALRATPQRRVVLLPEIGLGMQVPTAESLHLKVEMIPINASTLLPDLNWIAERVRASDVAAVVLLSPDNPSGVVLSMSHIDNLYAIAEIHDVTVILDQPLAWSALREVPLGAQLVSTNPNVRVGTVIDLSKGAGHDHPNMGVAVCSKRLADMLDEITQHSLGSREGLILAEVFAGHDALRALTENNYSILSRFLANTPARLLRSAFMYGPSVLVDVSETGVSGDEFASRLQADGIAVVPGSYFVHGNPDSPAARRLRETVRVSLVADPATIAHAAPAIAIAARDMQSRTLSAAI